MPKITSGLLCLALLLTACKPSREAIFRKIDAEVKTRSEAFTNLKTATEQIGHRLTGSENGHRAEEMAAQIFREAGFSQVDFQEFHVPAWTRRTVSFGTKTHPDQDGWEVIPSVSLALTPAQSSTDARLVDVGNGLRTDFINAGDAVAGNIVVLNLQLRDAPPGTKNLHRSEKVALAIEYGAAGVVFVNGVDGGVLLTGTASVDGKPVSIPAVCIGKEDGATLRKRLTEDQPPLYGHISAENHLGEITARNVVATLPGRGPLAAEEIWICGHLDSWDLSTGAIDNGIGSFTILDIARTFQAAKLKPLRTVRFVLTMGEEQGLLGSTWAVEQLKEAGELDKVRLMMNLDMAGNADGFELSGWDSMDSLVKAIGTDIQRIDTVFSNKTDSRPGLHSDHQPFMLQGIPVMGVMSNLDPSIYRFYHSNGDDFSLVNREHMENCVRFVAMMLYGLATVPELPLHRMGDAELKEFLIRHGLEEKLRLQGDWRW